MCRSPEVLFKLTDNEVEYHKSRVLKCNDQTSVRNLYGYYRYVLKNKRLALKWKEKMEKGVDNCNDI